MKKVLFSVLAMMALCSTLSAKILDFGVTAGMNINNTETETTDSNYSYQGWSADYKSGWYAGLQLKASLPLLGLGVDAAVTYSQNEATLKQSGGSSESETVGFLTVPVHARFDLDILLIDYAAVPFIFTGPQASYAMNKVEDKIKDLQNDNNVKIETNDLVWKWDIGAGVILAKHLQVAYAYEFPLTNGLSIKDKNDAKAISKDYKNGTHRLGVTYFF